MGNVHTLRRIDGSDRATGENVKKPFGSGVLACVSYFRTAFSTADLIRQTADDLARLA
jgi:hypothetical protein